jgi:hypothetical protein
VTVIWGGSYQTSAGVFNSGLYAPKGISMMYSSAYAKDVKVKSVKRIGNSRNFIF